MAESRLCAEGALLYAIPLIYCTMRIPCILKIKFLPESNKKLDFLVVKAKTQTDWIFITMSSFLLKLRYWMAALMNIILNVSLYPGIYYQDTALFWKYSTLQHMARKIKNGPNRM